MATGDRTPLIDNTLSPYFAWAGRSFPFAGDAADITISTNTTRDDAAGFKKVGKLTIAAGVTLTIAKSPFYIFANEISFGDASSCIDGSGPSGTAAASAFSSAYARGATRTSGSAIAQGGCGGIMLFVIANKISGANGLIKANGGNGYRNTTNASSNAARNGQGAMSSTLNSSSDTEAERWDGTTVQTGTNKAFYSVVGAMLSKGTVYGGSGGGSGGTSNSGIYGGSGSGIGGGGETNNSAGGSLGTVPLIPLTPDNLFQLAKHGCLGGGGAGVVVSTTGTNNHAGGGGGGSVVVWCRTYSATPTLSANGGIGSSAGVNDGAAGVTHLVQV